MSEALGVDLVGDLEPECSVLEVMVVAKVLDEDGDVMLWHSASKGLSTWEALGMAVSISDTLRTAMQECHEGGEDEG